MPDAGELLELSHVPEPLCQFVPCRNPTCVLHALVSVAQDLDFHTFALRPGSRKWAVQQ